MSEDSKGKVENLLTELGKKIDHLIDQAKDASEDVREEVDQKIEELKELPLEKTTGLDADEKV